MCSPDAPKTPPPLPAQAPPVAPVLQIGPDPIKGPAAAGKGRARLRIDRTQSAPGAAGSGLNIPA